MPRFTAELFDVGCRGIVFSSRQTRYGTGEDLMGSSRPGVSHESRRPGSNASSPESSTVKSRLSGTGRFMVRQIEKYASHGNMPG